MSVTLRKSSDYAPANSPFFAPGWAATVELWIKLQREHGEHNGDILYSGLADNNLDALRASLPKSLPLFNVPDHRGTVTSHADPVDYSDGYGGTYAPGE